jgi:TRAP-type mannitol/chloroaromatic compound transport system substrate-binding protein
VVLRALGAAAAIAAALLACKPAPPAAGASGGPARVKLKIQSGYPFNMPVLGEAVQHFGELVDAQPSAGVNVRLYDAGKLVPTLQIFDAVAAGRIDAGFAFPAYWMGKIPAATVFAAVPFGPDAPELYAWIQQGGGLELWRQAYAGKGVVPVPCGVLPPEASGWFREPVGGIADLEGKKIRYAGLGGKVLEKLGASITMLPAGDIFLALERGVIDATEYSMPAVDQPLGFSRVAKHYYFPGWHQPSSLLELLVNRDVWEGMAPEQRALVETACNANAMWSLTRGLAIQSAALDAYEAEGVTLERWSPEMLALFREAADEVMAEASASDPTFAEAWASLQAFRDEHRRWASIAYTD